MRYPCNIRMKPTLHFPVLVLKLAIACFMAGASASAEVRPNVIFILADDLGWNDTSLNDGSKFHQTPHLTRLAARGMTFSRAYAASPLCSPTRASIMTGQTPARTGITAPSGHLQAVSLKASLRKNPPPGSKVIECESATRLDTRHVTLAEALSGAGYATGHFGKWHLGAPPYSPLEQGFEVDVPHWPGPGPAGSFVAPWKYKDFKERTPGEHIEDRMAVEAISWMEKQKQSGRPFYLNYWQFSVHAPFDAKKKLIDKYKALANPENPQHCPTYAAMVESLDDNVGRILDAIDRMGIADNTIIIFFSDNGGNMYSKVDGTVPTSNAPLRGGKATIFEGGVRVPCVVSWPSMIQAGSKSAEVIQSTDFYPTLLDLLKIEAAPGTHFDGISIAPALKGGSLEREAIFTYFPHAPPVPDHLSPAVTVTVGDWKLIRLFHQGENGAHSYQLYNLKEDIGEKNDLAASQPERVKSLDALITQYLTDSKALVPTVNPSYDPAKAGARAPRSAKARKAATADDWKARACSAVGRGGALVVTPAGKDPFIAIGTGKQGGPVSFRAKSKSGGKGRVVWLPEPTALDQAASVEFTLKSGDWTDVTAAMPAAARPGIVRIHLPAADEDVELDWIELSPKAGGRRRWDF